MTGSYSRLPQNRKANAGLMLPNQNEPEKHLKMQRLLSCFLRGYKRGYDRMGEQSHL